MESKINLNLRKILVIVTTVVLIIVNMNLIDINAATAVTGNIKHSDWWLADPSTGRRDEHEAELTINGETAYCVDAFTVFKSGVTMTQGSFTDIGISRDIAKQLSLIVYFGTKVDGRTGKDWYAITQGLVWKTIHEAQGHSDMCYVETPTNPDYATTLRLWNEILKDIEDYKREPSFANAIYEVDADSTITLTDTNNALKNTIITNTGGLDVSISGNKLIIKGDETAQDNAIITLKRNIKPQEMGASFAYYNGVNQSVGTFKVADPLFFNLTVKVNKFGSLELVKYNEDKSAVVPNTSYHITGPNGFDETHQTNANGKIILDRLSLGDYKAVEVQAGNGYLINVQEFGFTIKANETTVVDPSNIEPKGKIELTKSIDTSQTDGSIGDAILEGNSYELYAKEKITNKAGTKVFYQKDQLIKTQKTDSNGKTIWDELPVGNYYIKEAQSNETLFLNKNSIDVSIQYQGQTVSKVLVNVETKNRVNMQKIQVFKSGEDEGTSGIVQGLKEAEFTWKLNSDVKKYGWENSKTYAVITTDENGKANTSYLPYGTYLVKETKTPLNYFTAPDFTVSVTDDYSEYTDVEQVKKININNAPFKSQVKLIKVDKDTNEKVTLNSASFKIKDSNGNYIVQKIAGIKIDTFTTNSQNQIIPFWGDQGTVMLPLSLGAGTYTVEEIKIPNGFLELEDKITFSITSQYDYDLDEDKQPILEVIVKNSQPKGELEITKTDKITNNPLVEVQYELSAKKDIINAIDGSVLYKEGEVVEEGKTDDNGKIKITSLFMGEYSLKEVLTNESYVLSQKVHDVTFKQEDTSTKVYKVDINVTNIAPTGEINIEKADKDTGEMLSGVIYRLIAKDDIISLDGRNTVLYKAGDPVSMDISEDGYYMTNEIGKINIAGLPLGNYLLSEVKPLDGYYNDKNEYDINLSYDGSEKIIYAKNLNLTNSETITEVSKTDIAGEKELEGAKLSLFDKDNNLIKEWVSTKETHIIRGLLINEEYRLHEDQAPLGYATTSDIVFKVKEDGVTQVTMKDDITKVDIYKVDALTNKGLAGAKLTLKEQESGKVISSWHSSIDKYQIVGLEVGKTYVLQEDEAPNGYQIAQDILFTVLDTAEVQKVIMKDEPKVEEVQTGDNTILVPIIMLLVGSGITIVIVNYRIKKSEDDDKK